MSLTLKVQQKDLLLSSAEMFQMSLSHTVWTQVRSSLIWVNIVWSLHIHLSIILANKCSRPLKQISFSGTLRIKVKQYVSFWTKAHLCHGPIVKILLGRVLTMFLVIKIFFIEGSKDLSQETNWTHGVHLLLKGVHTRIAMETYIAACDVPVGERGPYPLSPRLDTTIFAHFVLRWQRFFLCSQGPKFGPFPLESSRSYLPNFDKNPIENFYKKVFFFFQIIFILSPHTHKLHVHGDFLLPLHFTSLSI